MCLDYLGISPTNARLRAALTQTMSSYAPTSESILWSIL